MDVDSSTVSGPVRPLGANRLIVPKPLAHIDEAALAAAYPR